MMCKMRVKFYLSISVGDGQEEIVDLPDDFTDDEIEDELLEWRAGYLDSCWIKLDNEQ